ncbi:hypothetical protein DF142_20825 [Burkholderia cenocepacia]|nr:hypothetical protein DF142_20825 [Burkholderia cenocepacia]RQU63103.1 hypothetical protein DF140_22430 [Burkholderia cenocepacia]RQU96807.1 hypothetical protein DF040_04075 [Burkholderia cenocepacia]
MPCSRTLATETNEWPARRATRRSAIAAPTSWRTRNSAHTFRHGNVARFVVHVEATRTSSPSTVWAQSFFPHHPPERTTVATCGTTVVVRDAAVTLWA